MDFSINVLTLLGIVLSIGLVVDDAIVVLENMKRHHSMGKSLLQASKDGTKEIDRLIPPKQLVSERP